MTFPALFYCALAAAVLLVACGSTDGGAGSDPLDDGIVSAAEYDAAFYATYDCVREAGVEVSDPRRDGGQLVFNYGLSKSDSGLAEADVVYEDCFREHQEQVAAAYFAQPSVELDSGPNFLDCLFPEGRPDISAEEAQELIDTAFTDEELGACLDGG
ncbi:MAG: hypothetical protein GY701_14685 [Sulfitobacter sp.]|nr:hypothetical protein [Sulfitobacter sp.]